MNKITLYTDAGCSQGKGGFAFLFYFLNNKAKHILGYGNTKETNPLSIELIAIKKALEFMTFHGLNGYELEVHCDVCSIVDFFNNRNYTNYINVKGNKRYKKFIKSNLTVIQEIINLVESEKISNIRFVKVKSKKNIFNKFVHNYANLASTCLSGKEYSHIYELQEIYKIG